jgi:cytochrome b
MPKPSAERDEGNEGTEAGEAVEHEEENPLGDVHDAAVNLLYVLIALHLAGVIFETHRSGWEIVLAMLPGQR